MLDTVKTIWCSWFGHLIILCAKSLETGTEVHPSSWREKLGWITLFYWLVFLNSITRKAVFQFDCEALQAAEARAPSALNSSILHCDAGKMTSDIWQGRSSERGISVIAGDWEGWELNICNVIHAVSITLPFDILPAWLRKPAGLTHHPFTEGTADDRCWKSQEPRKELQV